MKIYINDIQNARKIAKENVDKQAKRIKDVHKGIGDLRNIIGVILQKIAECLYKVGTKHGVLQKLHCRYNFIRIFHNFL